MKNIILKIIKLYQKTLSPDLGWFSYKYPAGCCKYYPNCSSYSYQAIDKYGIIKGSFLSIKRILKCNPFSRGGYDALK